MHTHSHIYLPTISLLFGARALTHMQERTHTRMWCTLRAAPNNNYTVPFTRTRTICMAHKILESIIYSSHRISQLLVFFFFLYRCGRERTDRRACQSRLTAPAQHLQVNSFDFNRNGSGGHGTCVCTEKRTRTGTHEHISGHTETCSWSRTRQKPRTCIISFIIRACAHIETLITLTHGVRARVRAGMRTGYNSDICKLTFLPAQTRARARCTRAPENRANTVH